jgi:endoglucanase
MMSQEKEKSGPMQSVRARLAPFGTISRRVLGFGIAPVMLFCLAIFGARAADVPPPTLKHGVSLSNWFTDSGREPLVARDFDQIKAAGFDHVRIPVNPESLGFSLYDGESGRVLFDFSGLDAAIGMARDHGLSAILDIRPSDGLMTQIEQDPRAEVGLITLWQHIADHYKPYSTSTVVFELLDEPRFKGAGSQYRMLIGDVVAAIRQVAPKTTLIVDLPKSATLDGFDDFVQLSDDNTVYAFHFYEPYIITHQGMKAAPALGRALRYFRGLPYPAQTVNAAANYAPDAGDTDEVKKEIGDYTLANWDAGHVAGRIKMAADWAAANHRRVICTEFGVARRFIDPASRYQWIADTRKALEANNIGWALWDYTDAFGITKLTGDTIQEPGDGVVRLADPNTGTRDFEPEAIKALFGG